MKSHIPMHEPDQPFGYPGRNYDDTPAHFEAFDDRYEPPPVDPQEEDIIHYAPGNRPLCGNESITVVYTDDPHQVANAVATRYNKLANSYCAMVNLASWIIETRSTRRTAKEPVYISKATNSPRTTLNYPWPWPWWPDS